MKNHIALSAALFLLVAFGLFGGIRLSYINILGTNSCPHLGPIALCYIVAIGYLSMFLGLCISKFKLRKVLFWAGWTFVFLIALIGTGLELAVTTVCPKGFFSIPLCYLSLALCIATGLLFKGNNARSCLSKG